MLPHVLQVSEVATECCDDQADVDAVVGLKARDAVRQFKFRLLDSVSVAPPWCTVKPSKGDNNVFLIKGSSNRSAWEAEVRLQWCASVY